MADKKSFLDAVAGRRTIYTLSPENSPASDSRVLELVSHVIKHTPSSYNSQTARAIVLSDEHHRAFWDAVEKGVEQIVPPEVWSGMLSGAVRGHRNGGKGVYTLDLVVVWKWKVGTCVLTMPRYCDVVRG